MSEILTVPWIGVSGGSLELQTGHASNPARGFEYDQTLDLAAPRWVLRVQLDDRDPAVGGVLRAFLARLDARGGRFACHDPLRRLPLAYAFSTGRPWLANPANDARVAAISPSTWSVTLDRLAPGAVISPGDAISWATGGAQRLYRVVDLAPVTANGSGEATVSLAPRPRAVATGTAVRLDGATSVFQKVGQAPAAVSLAPGPHPVSLSIDAVEAF